MAFMAAQNIKKLVSGYHSIDMHFIVFSVKFNDGLSISALRYKQLYKKKWTPKIHIFNFQTPPLEKGQTLEKSSFLALIFLVNGMNDPTSI
jgi:hypothetical protein